MSQPNQSEQYDVTIIGAGIVGVCCALSLIERGKTVHLIDAVGVAEKTSYGNAGVISPWSVVPQAMPGMWSSAIKWLLDPLGPISIRAGYFPAMLPWFIRFLLNGRVRNVESSSTAMAQLMRDNIALYRQHLSGTGQEALLRDSYMIAAYRNPDNIDLNHISVGLRTKIGATVERIDALALRQLEPALSTDYQAAVVIKDQSRTVSPGRLAITLADKAQQRGARLSIASVNKLIPQENDKWQLETSEGTINANSVVVAAGAWSPTLLEPLGLKTPLAFERGYHLEFSDPGVSLNNSIVDVTHHFVTSSMEGGIRSAGTAEFDRLDRAPNYKRAEMLKPMTKAMLPDLNTDSGNQWMGIRPSFPDSLPCIDKMPGQQNLFLAFGHNHYGLGMAPQTGEFISSLIVDGSSSVDLSPYRASRF
ncbi:MAG: D-amino-acid dehydrogenase [Parasphingorhabdus sp.]